MFKFDSKGVRRLSSAVNKLFTAAVKSCMSEFKLFSNPCAFGTTVLLAHVKSAAFIWLVKLVVAFKNVSIHPACDKLPSRAVTQDPAIDEFMAAFAMLLKLVIAALTSVSRPLNGAPRAVDILTFPPCKRRTNIHINIFTAAMMQFQ